MIETERLLLRPPVAGDEDAVAEAFADPEVMRYIGGGQTGDYEDAVERIEAMQSAWRLDGFGAFMAIRKEDGRALGRIGITVWDPAAWKPGIRAEIGELAEIEIGWVLSYHAWGQGYATEAAAAVRDWAFEQIRPRRLISLIHPDNARSKRVATKIGERFDELVTTHRGIPAELWTFS